MKVKDLIYSRRKQLGLTLEDIASYVGVSRSTVKKWESGFIKNMKRDKMALLAEILKVPPTDLLYDEKVSSVVLNDLTESDKKILRYYRVLNESGQEKVISYALDLVDSGKYSIGSSEKQA